MADIHRTRSRQMILETNSNKLPELSFGVYEKTNAVQDAIQSNADMI